MNVIVVGAGNAGRPVARLLNYAGHTVKITDPKNIEDFHMDVQKTLRLMESEGVELDLGVFEPNLDGIDTVYLSPHFNFIFQTDTFLHGVGDEQELCLHFRVVLFQHVHHVGGDDDLSVGVFRLQRSLRDCAVDPADLPLHVDRARIIIDVGPFQSQ